MGWNETDHPREQSTGRFSTKQDAGTTSDLDTDPRIAFERILARQLDDTYPGRVPALNMATGLEPYEGPITLGRRGRGYGMQSDYPETRYESDIPCYSDGFHVDEIDWHGREPDDWMVCDTMDCDKWVSMPLVQDWLMGRESGITVGTCMPAAWDAEADEQDADVTVDASNLIILCADRTPQGLDLPDGWEHDPAASRLMDLVNQNPNRFEIIPPSENETGVWVGLKGRPHVPPVHISKGLDPDRVDGLVDGLQSD